MYQVEIFDDQNSNIAVLGPATHNSPSVDTYPASNAIDGNFNTFSESNTNEGGICHWEIILDQSLKNFYNKKISQKNLLIPVSYTHLTLTTILLV